MIVVATDPANVVAVQRQLAGLGLREPVGDAAVLAVAPGRRLVRAAAVDEWAAERAVAALRADGLIAVNRPDGGPRLAGWQEHTRPVTFGDRLSVCVAWAEHDRADRPGLIELGLGGFGNGHHPTTCLLIDELLSRVRGGERVLDVGCGSGVLGLAALRLGAAHLVAVDIDPASVAATQANAELNGLAGRVEATLDPLTTLAGPFDVIVANVARAAIVAFAPELVRLLAPGGWLAVSGITPSQGDQVGGFLHPLVEVRRTTADDWTAVVFAR